MKTRSPYIIQHDAIIDTMRRLVLANPGRNDAMVSYAIRKAYTLTGAESLKKSFNDRVRLARRMAAHHGKTA